MEARKKLQKQKLKYIRQNYDLYLFILPAFLFLFIFSYIPIYGIIIAFKDYSIRRGIIGSEWVGFENFIFFFKSPSFNIIIKNTLTLSLYSLVVGFPLPIGLALLLHHMPSASFKKSVQTITYAPYFISTVVMVGMIAVLLSPRTGVVNLMIKALGREPIFFLGDPKYFSHIYVWSGIWQGIGWSSIIYIAALSGVIPDLYEAAEIDGASILQKIIHIDIPCIKPTIVILLILSTGSILSVGFEKVYLMQNSLNLNTSEVISTYTYKMGLINARYDYGAAIGLLNNGVNAIILFIVNMISRRVGSSSLW